MKRKVHVAAMTLAEFLALDSWRRTNIKRTGTAYVLQAGNLVTVTITDYVAPDVRCARSPLVAK